MLRTGHSLLANALVHTILVAVMSGLSSPLLFLTFFLVDWRRLPCPVVRRITLHMYRSLPGFSAPLRLKLSVFIGWLGLERTQELGTDVGQWFGPSIAAGRICSYLGAGRRWNVVCNVTVVTTPTTLPARRTPTPPPPNSLPLPQTRMIRVRSFAPASTSDPLSTIWAACPAQNSSTIFFLPPTVTHHHQEQLSQQWSRTRGNRNGHVRSICEASTFCSYGPRLLTDRSCQRVFLLVELLQHTVQP